MVQQDVLLFAGDVEYNIGLGKADISRAQVEAAARSVNAAPFIENLVDGYGHVVAERGASFSAGQRQLLAFARALAAAPNILVLDEATASIDTETETLIQQALLKLMQGRTSLVIAHRLSTIRNADVILVLENGQIVQRGTHNELISQPGAYHDLHTAQARI